jgi:hypothetical protein
MDRPALAKLLDDVRARRVDVIVVYRVDRLTRSLADFTKLVEMSNETCLRWRFGLGAPYSKTKPGDSPSAGLL